MKFNKCKYPWLAVFQCKENSKSIAWWISVHSLRFANDKNYATIVPMKNSVSKEDCESRAWWISVPGIQMENGSLTSLDWLFKWMYLISVLKYKHVFHQFLQYSILKQQWVLDSKTYSFQSGNIQNKTILTLVYTFFELVVHNWMRPVF